MGEAYRLQTRARSIAAQARLPQAQTATTLDEPLESVVQALSRQRPMFHEPGQRRPHALASRFEIARVESLLDEAEATIGLLASLGLTPVELGRKAEEAGLGPAVVKGSVALRSLVESQLRGEAFSLRGATDEPRETRPPLRRSSTSSCACRQPTTPVAGRASACGHCWCRHLYSLKHRPKAFPESGSAYFACSQRARSSARPRATLSTCSVVSSSGCPP